MTVLKQYAIRSAAGKLLKIVSIRESDLKYQFVEGETGTPATEADLAEHRARISQLLGDARALRDSTPDPLEVLTEAIKAKHGLTDADLEAAAATLQARRKGGAGAGKRA